MTLPNYISIARGVAGPVLGSAFAFDLCSPEFVFAGVIMAGFSDWLDGYVARKMGLNSVAGTYLDPLGDKLFVCSMAVALGAKGLIPVWLGCFLVARDVSLIAGAWTQRGRALGWRWDTWGQFFAGTEGVQFGDTDGTYQGGSGLYGFGDQESLKKQMDAPPVPPVKPELIGKISTCAQFALFGGALGNGASGGEMPGPEVMQFLVFVTGGATFASTATYFFRNDAYARRR